MEDSNRVAHERAVGHVYPVRIHPRSVTAYFEPRSPRSGARKSFTVPTQHAALYLSHFSVFYFEQSVICRFSLTLVSGEEARLSHTLSGGACVLKTQASALRISCDHFC